MIVVAALVVVLAVGRLRRFVFGWTRRLAVEAMTAVRNLRSPRRVAQILGGNLVTEVLASRAKQHAVLQQFAPNTKQHDWHRITAGQRVQIMKKGPDGKAVIQFGTEVVAGGDGTIAGLLGASPGASTAVPIMLDVLATCFPQRLPAWEPQLTRMIPSYGTTLSEKPKAATKELTDTAKTLGLAV